MIVDATEKFPIYAKENNNSYLLPIDFMKIPFYPRRVFYVNCAEIDRRGGHGHKVCEQFLVCSSGSIIISMESGFKKEKGKVVTSNSKTRITLNVGEGIYIPAKTYVVYQMAKNTSIIVFASHSYDESDYVYSRENLA